MPLAISNLPSFLSPWIKDPLQSYSALDRKIALVALASIALIAIFYLIDYLKSDFSLDAHSFKPASLKDDLVEGAKS